MCTASIRLSSGVTDVAVADPHAHADVVTAYRDRSRDIWSVLASKCGNYSLTARGDDLVSWRLCNGATQAFSVPTWEAVQQPTTSTSSSHMRSAT